MSVPGRVQLFSSHRDGFNISVSDWEYPSICVCGRCLIEGWLRNMNEHNMFPPGDDNFDEWNSEITLSPLYLNAYFMWFEWEAAGRALSSALQQHSVYLSFATKIHHNWNRLPNALSNRLPEKFVCINYNRRLNSSLQNGFLFIFPGQQRGSRLPITPDPYAPDFTGDIFFILLFHLKKKEEKTARTTEFSFSRKFWFLLLLLALALVLVACAAVSAVACFSFCFVFFIFESS